MSLLIATSGAVQTSGGGTPVGAMPAFSAWGTFYANATLAATHNTIVHPATLVAGDLMILSVMAKNSDGNVGLAMHSSMSAAGWLLVGGATYADNSGNQRHLLAWKIAAGTEDGTSIPGGIVGTGGATSDGIVAACARFTAADGFSVNPFEDIALVSAGSGFNTTVDAPSVTPEGVNRRGVAMVGHSHNATMGSFTGESGSDWTLAATAGSNGSGSLHCQTCDLSASLPVSGGTATASASTVDLVVGFALVPAGGGGFPDPELPPDLPGAP